GRIGFSDKDPVEQVGFRGIGIWSGAAICDEVMVSTKMREDPIGHVLKIDARGLRADIQEASLPLVDALSRRVAMRSLGREEFRGKHGTRVELKGLLPENLPALSKESILAYAR